MKRILAALLCAVMLISSLPIGALALDRTDSVQTGSTVSALELPGESRLETSEIQSETDTYAPDEMVTVIVELSDAPVLSGFETKDATISAGLQVSQYLASPTAAAQQEKILDTQTAVLQSLKLEDHVVAQWTNVVNGFAVEIPYGQLETLRSTAGVKCAYVEKVYDRPVETLSDSTISGTYGYSYNMTGLAEAWDAGYTGQGMLIAVLDTGLDLTYTSWGDSADLQTGVRRVHEAFTDDSFMHDPEDAENGWELRYTNESLRLFLETTQLWSTSGSNGKITWDNNALYKNRKVPYACDYADADMNVQPSDSDHGTHVTGTIAGYAETDEGEVIFSGVAPDAQILSMKVFPDADGGAQESVIYSALEDAALLGADVMNLSLGSDNGFAEDDTLANEAYTRIRATGILFMVSAGNAGSSSYSNNYGDYNLTSDPEISMISSPAVYADNLAVASIENTVTARSAMLWYDTDGTETKISFQDPTDIAMKYKFGGAEPVNVIPVDGYGTYSDYYNAGFRGYYGNGDKGVAGIALVKRGGGISFVDKINTATQFSWSYYDPSVGYYVTEYPIKAVIIYDEDPESTELIYMSTDGAALTSAFISGKDGAALFSAAKTAIKNGSYVTLTVQKEDDVIASETAGQMSSFSSWGAGPSLELKPEITAPGGNIWSAVVDQTYSPSSYAGTFDDYTGSYGMMSGTSMASPHMSGITALVEQYIYTELGLSAKTAVANLAANLMVSTAIPQKNTDGVYYSPRQQGAGLVNVGAAISTPAYISVDGQNVGKLELKDDPDRTGAYEMTFHVHNLTDSGVTYNATAYVLRPATQSGDTTWGERSFQLDSDAVLKEVSLGTVTVPASGNTTVSQTVTLSDEEKAQLDELFPNGTYIEGFIVLTNDTDPQIGLPFLAFYGDWTAAPIFDSGLWIDEPEDGETMLNNESQWGVSVLGYFDGYAYYNMGQNPFDSFAGTNQGTYRTENITVSPTGLFRSVNDFVLYQKREAKVVVVEVKDAATGETYYRDYTAYQFKSYYDSSYGMVIPSSVYYFTDTAWDGTDLDGNVLPSGTECIYTITAYGDGEYDTYYESEAGRFVTDIESVIPGVNEPTFNGHPMDMTGDVITMPVMVDTEAPKLVNAAVSIEEVDGRVLLTGTFEDDGSIASVEVYPQVSRRYAEGYGNPDYVEYGLDLNNPFYSEMIYDADAHTWTFTCDVTEYAHTNESYPGESYYYQFDWTGNVYIYGGDYGGNDRAYAVTVNSNPGIVLSTTSALLNVGDYFDLSVNNNTGSDAALTRTSSNPEVATIDEFGHVEALTPGQTVLTISNGETSAICIVAVKEKSTEVLDFKLSIESFSGLKPGGTMIVKVQDLQPADVELTEIKWVVTEDDPDLYEGLINCTRYDATGLIGELYLNYSATGDPSTVIPGAKGTLSVTLNGVTRTMKLDWEDLYTYSNDEDLVSNLSFYDQTVYVTQGETATLHARYNDSSAHSVIPVALYTAKNYVDYSYDNTTDPAEGLILDGPAFCNGGSTWTGKLVNEEGYALPERIRIFTRYSYGYEYEMQNSWRTEYTYDNQTGEIVVYDTPTAGTSTLVIRADGVVSEGNPAGTVSGSKFTVPDGLYGPFDWEVVSGSGELTTAENVTVNYSEINVAYFVPSEPGVSIIKATTKDGKYSLNFAVISEPVLPETVELDVSKLTIHVPETYQLTATLSPTPTLERHEALTWKSYNPEVATVDENGVVTAVAPGYAFITTVSPYTGALDSCVVEVLGCEHSETTVTTTEATCTVDGSVVTTCDICGAVLSAETIEAAHSYEAVVTDPTCTEGGYITYTCSVCGDSYVADHTDAKGHHFESVVVAPTEQECGYTEYTCTDCGYVYHDAFTAATQCPSARFTDLNPDAWYHEAVDFVVAGDLMKGTSDTTFDPYGEMTRAQVVTVLYRLAGEPEVTGTAPFTDVPAGRYYSDAVIWAYSTGITKGVSADAFDPYAPVTRQQLVTFFARYAAANGVEIKTQGDLSGYTDAGSVSAYAYESMVWAVESGLIKGVSDTELQPGGTATRVQTAAILMRYCEHFE